MVGVSWKQAVAFSKWRTHILDNYLNDREEPLHDQFRLPTESEEYAAREDMISSLSLGRSLHDQ